MSNRPFPRMRPPSALAPIEEHPGQSLDFAIHDLRTDILTCLDLLRPQLEAIEEKYNEIFQRSADLRAYVFQPAKMFGRLQIILGRKVIVEPEEWRTMLILRANVTNMLEELRNAKELLRTEIDHLLSSLPRQADVEGPGYLKPLSVAVVSLGAESNISVLTLDPLASTGGGWI
ncbi:hypothetical protein P167DRAFT_545568 [Morchella conica CCBAS932]|uniref:Uncharacterized protein n=1 Tax=Morchella conica CCBAS932 TaxID=1392247 RepID=A0A3N4KP03_9PEZI|nr:hypothetical protein P167DRAFT_545568 [Morchella conica CCBAS932]